MPRPSAKRVEPRPPNSLAGLLKRREEAIPRGVYNIHSVFIRKGDGARVEGVDGQSFIDFASGINVLNLGHNHPAVSQAVMEQAGRFLHLNFHVTMYEGYLELAERLNDTFPGVKPAKTMFVNSGAEAIENAVKIARKASQRSDIVVFENAFHGRTLLALALTSRPRPAKLGFGPLPGGVHRFPYAYCYRCPLGLTYPSCEIACLGLFERALATSVDPEEIATVVVEPIQGEAGVIVPPREFLPRLAELCSRHGILLTLDEIATGLGRTGRMFACEHWGLQPNLITMAKALGGGLPLGAVIGERDVMDAPEPGGLGSTFGGNPLACAAGLAAFTALEEDGLMARPATIEGMLIARLQKMMDTYKIIGDVRVKGCLAGVELVHDRVSKEPAKEKAQMVLQECQGRGVIAAPGGPYTNVVRVMPPLTISDEDLAQGLDILEAAIAKADSGR